MIANLGEVQSNDCKGAEMGPHNVCYDVKTCLTVNIIIMDYLLYANSSLHLVHIPNIHALDTRVVYCVHIEIGTQVKPLPSIIVPHKVVKPSLDIF